MNMLVPKSIEEELASKGINVEKERTTYFANKSGGAPVRSNSATPAPKKTKAEKKAEAEAAKLKGSAGKRALSAVANKVSNLMENNDPADIVCHAHLRGLCAHTGAKCKTGKHVTQEKYDEMRKEYRKNCAAHLDKISS